jgi:(E)-4-hydroxy-3-methylbut-2-enyl-diphosphate synthase
MVGGVAVGGGAPLSVQSMANVPPTDQDALVGQIERCAALGCDIFRLTVPDEEAAKTFAAVRRLSPIPLVADIHFDWRSALAAIEAGCDALRINPGNIGSQDRISAVARRAKEKKIPIRVGVNLGSLERDIDVKLRAGEITAPEALYTSAMRHVKILEDEKFYDVVISAKASNVLDTVSVYRMLAEKTDIPLHIGVTEAGLPFTGTVRSSVALGILLGEGIGDTMRISLTAEPEKEVRVGVEILRSLGLRRQGPAITSCPTCGRTKVDLTKIASEVEAALEKLYFEECASGRSDKPFPRVAVMGCAVNGPGEAKGADVALCGGDGEFLIYVRGKQMCKVPQNQAVGKVLEYVVSLR